MSSTDIRSILDRLATVESKLTPVTVKHGLNKQQKSVDQLPALFKPKNISPTLTKKPYQKHPMDGKLVGDSVEPTKSPLEEAMQEVEEDMLGKIKGDFISYLDKLEKKIRHDDDLRDRETPNLDKLEKKQSVDRDLVEAKLKRTCTKIPHSRSCLWNHRLLLYKTPHCQSQCLCKQWP